MSAMQDPSQTMNMMKKNMAMIIPNMLLMGWVSYFFSGFVMMKLPFILSEKFKPMLQRGIMIPNLDVSYVSALSFYFVCSFGLRGLNTILLGANAKYSDPTAMMRAQQQMTTAQGPMKKQINYNTLYQKEKNEIEIVNDEFVISSVELRLATENNF